jgi:Mrp family chromosome partitioning ATPase
MDPMQRAVERARQNRDGDIGKTATPASAVPIPDGDDEEILAELGLSLNESLNESQPARPVRRQPRMHPARLRFTETQVILPDRAKLLENRVIAGSVHDQRAEVYRQLRSQVLNRLRKHRLSNFAITSAHEDAGKTLTAVNLAISMSMELNQTVLLVDLDLRVPGIHETLAIDTKYGVIDYLRSDVPVQEILVSPGYERLVVLPGRPADGSLSELLTSPEMRKLFDDITGRYDDRIVIFDLPPLLRNDDAMAFLPLVDACLYVIEDDVTTVADMQRSLSLLADTQLLGTILNKAV